MKRILLILAIASTLSGCYATIGHYNHPYQHRDSGHFHHRR